MGVHEALVAGAGLRRREPRPEIGIPRSRAQRLGKGRGISGRNEEAGLAVLDHLGHAADARGDDRPSRGLRLEDHERRILPPERGHHDPIHIGHPAGQRGPVIGTGVLGEGRAAASAVSNAVRKAGSGWRRPPWKASRSSAPSAFSCAAASSRVSTPLCRASVPKKAKRSRRTRGLSCISASGSHRVRHELQLRRGQAPVEEAVLQEAARGKETVHALQQGREIGLAQGVPVGAELRKTGAAAVGPGAAAAGSVGAGEQQPFVRADDLIVVQCHDDAGRRGEAAKSRQDLCPDPVEPVQMDHIGRSIGQKAPDRFQPAQPVVPLHQEPVVAAGAQHHVLAEMAEAARHRLGPLKRGRGRKEARVEAAARQGAMQVMRHDLGAAARPVGMIVRDLQDAERHQRPSAAGSACRRSSSPRRASANPVGWAVPPKRRKGWLTRKGEAVPAARSAAASSARAGARSA